MSRPTKSLDPADRLGVYKTLDDVPGRYRLYHHEDRYEGEETWQEFAEQHEYPRLSERQQTEVDRAGDHWKVHMNVRGWHHALATPDDVETWCADLVDDKSERRAHDYFLRVRRFFDWLQWHIEHPHRYNPVLMAAVEGEAARRIWRYKARQNRQNRQQYRRQTNE